MESNNTHEVAFFCLLYPFNSIHGKGTYLKSNLEPNWFQHVDCVCFHPRSFRMKIKLYFACIGQNTQAILDIDEKRIKQFQ